MALRINRLRIAMADDVAFLEIVSALPDGSDRCLCCRRSSRDSLAMILVADESDHNPRVLCAVVCSMCSAVQSIDQLLADWAQQLIERYGGIAVPDRRFADTLAESG